MPESPASSEEPPAVGGRFAAPAVGVAVAQIALTA